MPGTTRGASTESASRLTSVSAVVSILLSLVAIIVCGSAGALAAFALVDAIALTGAVSALVAVATGVVVSTLLWVIGFAALRSIGWLK